MRSRIALLVIATALLGLVAPAAGIAAASSMTATSVTSFAGIGRPTPGVNGGNGGPATQATFDATFGVVTDHAGNVYISDSENAVVRKVDTSGIVTAFAGTGVRGHSGDGAAAVNAQLGSDVFGLGIDSAGNVYIGDEPYIRKVDTNGVISTIAGNGQYPATGHAVPPDGTRALDVPVAPYALTADSAGNVYFSDLWAGYVREVRTDGTVKNVAGNGAYAASNAGDGGPALSALVGMPGGLLVGPSGELYMSDLNQVRIVSPTGTISTVAGTGVNGDSGDGGPATAAQLTAPYGLAQDGQGDLFISDFGVSKVRMVAPDGAISTIAGYGTGDGSDPLQGLAAGTIQLALSPDGGTLYGTETGQVQAIHLTVTGSPPTAGNQPPVFVAAPQDTVFPAAGVGSSVTFTVQAVDPENEAVRLTWSTLPTRPLVSCVQNIAPPPLVGTIATCTVRTTKQVGATAQTILFFAEDPEGQTSSAQVVIGGSKNATITIPRSGVEVPAIESQKSTDWLRVDLTNDDKDPICGNQVNDCLKSVGFLSYFTTQYFKKATDTVVRLRNVSRKLNCDSTDTRASRVTALRPNSQSDAIGYRVQFDANCGKTSTPSYDGIVVDVLIMDPVAKKFAAISPTGLSGAQLVVGSLAYLAQFNHTWSLAADQLEAIEQILDAKDNAKLALSVGTTEFRKELAGIIGQKLAPLALRPPTSITSSAATTMFEAAAAVVRAEAANAFSTHRTLTFRESLTLNGNKSSWRLLVADPAELNGSSGWVPIVSLQSKAAQIMSIRADVMAGLARSSG